MSKENDDFVKELRAWAGIQPISSAIRHFYNKAADCIEQLEREKADQAAEIERLKKLLSNAQEYIHPNNPEYKDIEQALKGAEQ